MYGRNTKGLSCRITATGASHQVSLRQLRFSAKVSMKCFRWPPTNRSVSPQYIKRHHQSSGLLKGEETSVKAGGTVYCVLLNCGVEGTEIVTSNFRIRNKRTTTTIVYLLPINGRSQWSHSLRRGFSAARLLG